MVTKQYYMGTSNSKFQKLVNNGFLFRFFLLKNLPLGYITGIKVKILDNEQAITTVKYKWITQNPFRSMYFACMAMAAELSTGLLVMDKIFESKPAISMLVIGNHTTYHKKAIGKITFTCQDGKYISEMIEKAKQTKEACVLDVRSTGIDESGDKVAEFVFTWSVKVKK